jgi:hypothetical protein
MVDSMMTLWRGTLFVLLAGWVSSITMLYPWPPRTIAVLEELVETHAKLEEKQAASSTPETRIQVAHQPIWNRWILNLLFVVGGTLFVLLTLRGSKVARGLVVGFSGIYLAYWLSEYMLSLGPASSVVAAVIRQINDGDLLRKTVIIQHQILLPLIHLGGLIIAGISRMPIVSFDSRKGS